MTQVSLMDLDSYAQEHNCLLIVKISNMISYASVYAAHLDPSINNDPWLMQ